MGDVLSDLVLQMNTYCLESVAFSLSCDTTYHYQCEKKGKDTVTRAYICLSLPTVTAFM